MNVHRPWEGNKRVSQVIGVGIAFAVRPGNMVRHGLPITIVLGEAASGRGRALQQHLQGSVQRASISRRSVAEIRRTLVIHEPPADVIVCIDTAESGTRDHADSIRSLLEDAPGCAGRLFSIGLIDGKSDLVNAACELGCDLVAYSTKEAAAYIGLLARSAKHDRQMVIDRLAGESRLGGRMGWTEWNERPADSGGRLTDWDDDPPFSFPDDEEGIEQEPI